MSTIRVDEKNTTMISDALGRTFKTLRISLLDSCNLACTYCVSPDKDKLKGKSGNRLTVDEIIQLVRRLRELVPLDVIRLTGGEPLLYKEIVPLVYKLKELGIPQVKMTTNGVYLARHAHALKEAGIDSVNVSLDALEEEVFYKISRRRNVKEVLDGIEEARAAGIPLKINAVIMKGINESQILPLFEYASERDITVRFLELMKMGHLYFQHSNFFFPQEEIMKVIQGKYEVIKVLRTEGATANYWITEDLKRFGIIANSSSPFCHDCNRLRLDSNGNIYGCLSSTLGINIRNLLDDRAELAAGLKSALAQKQNQFQGSSMSMKSIGG